MKGLIFNIMRYSVNDGPGIRTTVFFKGCPLSCKWCHNPESISPVKEVMLRVDRCIRCGRCYSICSHNAIEKVNGDYQTLRETCTRCGECIDECFAEARTIVGKEISVDELLDEILKDQIFYDQSGGGVTFSGGEPLMQHEFLFKILSACKVNNISTAIDTSGYTALSVLEKVSSLTDLFLYDLKILDDTTHRGYTAVSNKIILNNLEQLLKWKKKVIIRIPLIPGVNDSLDNIKEFGIFSEKLKIEEINLLPYHKIGINKYERLGKEYQIDSNLETKNENIIQYVEVLKEFVPKVVIGG